ncbi:hypothetical protein PENSTE_c012G07101 [Penicillium steckii]|uniref:Uncharacterized protein n=1 Tax=Penicillium steckii TaxID=303698 RepID=A0A1V6T482_9EURO|nr:hypothetical protein PENSTE_c012G07101 [Penicillium steckii]
METPENNQTVPHARRKLGDAINWRLLMQGPAGAGPKSLEILDLNLTLGHDRGGVIRRSFH